MAGEEGLISWKRWTLRPASASVGTVLPGPPRRNRALSSAHRKIALNRPEGYLGVGHDDPSGGLLPPQPGLVSGPPALCPQSPAPSGLRRLPPPSSWWVRATQGRALRTLLRAGCQARPVDPLPAWPGQVRQAHGAPRGLLGQAMAGGTQPRPAFELKRERAGRCPRGQRAGFSQTCASESSTPRGPCVHACAWCVQCVLPALVGRRCLVGFAAGRWCAVRPRAGAPSRAKQPALPRPGRSLRS